ncbi:hypothetical protein QBC36DRAFT_312210 [Triangularia setosa]|uniref:Uncharacterized protein n=1 Tax=Triangularia setosa TaxID=2587417 RepID=A0AAN6W6S3_9PEZI|nr:hypothetical protein QBC36DRAFT_312210 [Podospora setosa]
MARGATAMATYDPQWELVVWSMSASPCAKRPSPLLHQDNTASTLNLSYTPLSHRALTNLLSYSLSTDTTRIPVSDSLRPQNPVSAITLVAARKWLLQIRHVCSIYPPPASYSTDDTGWYALALLLTYDPTHNTTYLDTTKKDEECMWQYWSNSACNGGLIQDIKYNSYKNAISNELHIALTVGIYLHTHESTYLSKARTAWNRFEKSGVIKQAQSRQ